MSSIMGDGSLLFALAMAAACFFLMRRAARRIAKQRQETASRSSYKVAEKPPSIRLQEDAARCQVALYDLARDLQGELESKARVLQILVAQARTEAERLERLLEEFDVAANLPSAAASDPLGEDVGFPFAGGSPRPSPPERSTTPERAEEVYRRADAGESAAAIADSLARPLADVELLLSLRP
ncbi:MAG: hypothetical protein KY475_07340 [Planctomycetes bacterium]|nr:hypothetical protein [Planctomycetota bacterium]